MPLSVETLCNVTYSSQVLHLMKLLFLIGLVQTEDYAIIVTKPVKLEMKARIGNFFDQQEVSDN